MSTRSRFGLGVGAVLAVVLSAGPSWGDALPELQPAAELLARDDYAGAAVAAADQLQSPNPEVALEARMIAAKGLYRMGLFHAALLQYQVVLAAGPRARHFAKALEWLVFISRKTRGQSLLAAELARQPLADFPERYRSELYVLLARHHAALAQSLELAGRPDARAELDEVRKLTRQVPASDPFGARAKLLEATVDLHDDRLADAVAGFKQVLRLTSGADADAEVRAVRELALMQLARTAYAQKQDRYAAAYYAKVPRGSAQWADALFESSWAHYRLGDDERALGNLVTLASPYFAGKYQPESFIIRAIVLYENCGFPEAKAVLDAFEGEYRPVREVLKELLAAGVDPEALYDRLESGAGPMRRILRLALSQPEVASASTSISELEAELDRLSRSPDALRYSALAQELEAALKARRTELKARAGAVARARLELEAVELDHLLADALRIRFEVLEREKTPLEAQLAGKTAAADQLVQYEFSREVDEDEAYWPLGGEYWRDELGTYLYTLPKGCAAHRTSAAAPGSSK
ncbi:MAG: adventurous gliding motility protein GltC [Archangiaceae bacterium]|nr:adventurous gliding motility protein GltC [Archangiaceae bacterium]